MAFVDVYGPKTFAREADTGNADGAFSETPGNTTNCAGLKSPDGWDWVFKGHLRIRNSDYLGSGGIICPGSDAQLDQEVEILLPAGAMAQGDGVYLKLREQDDRAYKSGGEAAWVALALYHDSASRKFRIEAYNASDRGVALLYDIGAGWYDLAKGYWIRWRATGSNPTTLSWLVREDRSGMPGTTVSSGTKTLGPTGDLPDTGLAHIQTTGWAGLGNHWNKASNGGTARASQVAVVRFATQRSAGVPLRVAGPALASRTLTQNILTVTPTGGSRNYRYAWHNSMGGEEFTIGAANRIAGSDRASLVHTHGRAKYALHGYPLGAPLSWYRASVSDGASTVVNNGVMVEDLWERPDATVRADLLRRRRLLVALFGDSITNDPSIENGVKAALAGYGVRNVGTLRVARNGSQLGRDWQLGSRPYNTDNPEANTNGYPPGTPRLIQHFVDRVEAALALPENRGALVLCSGMLGTNDSKLIPPATFVGWWVVLRDYIHVMRRHPDWLLCIHGIPYKTVETPTGNGGYAAIRHALLTSATLARGRANNTWHGAQDLFYAFYLNPGWLLDGTHPNPTGQVEMIDRWVRGLVLGPLAQGSAP